MIVEGVVRLFMKDFSIFIENDEDKCCRIKCRLSYNFVSSQTIFNPFSILNTSAHGGHLQEVITPDANITHFSACVKHVDNRTSNTRCNDIFNSSHAEEITRTISELLN